LNPVELGMVQVQIDRPVNGPAQVSITAERADTLQMLQQDQPQLRRTLDAAGIPSDGRVISFHVAAVAASASGAGTGGLGSGSGFSGSGQTGAQSGPQGGTPGPNNGGGSGGYASRDQGAYGGNRRPASAQDVASAQADPAASPATPRWFRAGLDITA
jgi:hypothetical protein